MLRYAITDRRLFPGTEAGRRAALAAQAARLSGCGVDFFQVREKDLNEDDLLLLTIALREAAAECGGKTRVLLNGHPEVALAAGVGLHLPYSAWVRERRRVASVSCHNAAEAAAVSNDAEVILFGPVFEKSVAGERVQQGRGIEALAEVCAAAKQTPVLALGGTTAENAGTCIAAGARGVAGIRMFLSEDVA